MSGTEVDIDDELVRVGMMPASHKLDDVRRDARVEIHSAPLENDLTEGDAKLTGMLIEIGDTAEQSGTAFRLDISRASLVRVVGGQLEFSTWATETGRRTQRRR